MLRPLPWLSPSICQEAVATPSVNSLGILDDSSSARVFSDIKTRLVGKDISD